MTKAFNDYELYVFDLDGTLYDQPKLRKIMATRLLKYYLRHLPRAFELFDLMKFRKLKDNWDEVKKESENTKYDCPYPIGSLDAEVVLHIAKGNSKKADKISEIVYKWIYENPITALKETRDQKLCELIEKLKEKGKRVVVFSDYPVEDKLKALEVIPHGMYCATDEKIGEYKPSSKGLEVIIEDYKISRDKVLMIGDRLEKDGQCAINAKVDYLILERDINSRNYEII